MSPIPAHPPSSPNGLGLAAAARAIASGALDSEGLVDACLARIEARQASVQAWVHLDPDGVRREARRCDREAPRGPLHGVPIGIKDIIDTADFPTERGSALYAGRAPERDAACVTRLRAAGAILLGKTVTTEFAFFAPGPTANPHALAHTPGGSSSGSAAAVADLQVPAALGTQTAGSVIRPAAFCGVLGMKPSYGRVPVEGVLPLAPSLDTVGFFAREVEDLALLGAVLAGLSEAPAPTEPARVALLRTPVWERGEPSMREALEGAAARLEADGCKVWIPDAAPLEGLTELQNTLLAAEALEVLGPRVARDPSRVRPQTLELLDAGARVPERFPGELQRGLERARTFFETEVFPRADLVLTPAAPGEAPRGLDATGDPVFNRIWTLLGLPCVALPMGRGPAGLPLAAQLVGPWQGDAALLRALPAVAASLRVPLAPPADERD